MFNEKIRTCHNDTGGQRWCSTNELPPGRWPSSLGFTGLLIPVHVNVHFLTADPPEDDKTVSEKVPRERCGTPAEGHVQRFLDGPVESRLQREDMSHFAMKGRWQMTIIAGRPFSTISPDLSTGGGVMQSGHQHHTVDIMKAHTGHHSLQSCTTRLAKFHSRTIPFAECICTCIPLSSPLPPTLCTFLHVTPSCSWGLKGMPSGAQGGTSTALPVLSLSLGILIHWVQLPRVGRGVSHSQC